MSHRLRWIVGLVVVVALFGAAVAMRLYVKSTQPHEQATTTARVVPVSKWPTANPRRGMAGGEEESLDAPAGEAAPRRPASAPPRAAVAPGPPIKPGVEGEAAPPQVVIKKPPRAAPDAAPGSEPAEAEGTNPTPLGPALSLSFDRSTTAADQTAPIMAQDVVMDPAGGAALFPPTAVLAYPDRGGIDPEQGTVALWVAVKEPPGPNGRTLLSLGAGTWENRLGISIAPAFVGFLFATADGVEAGVGSGIPWKTDEWHHVAVTWGEAQALLYIDGELRDARTYAGSFSIPPNAPLYVASPRGHGDASPGTVAVRGLQIFQRVLSGDEVNTVLAQTVPPRQ